MLAGINDSQEVAHQLGALLKDHKVVLSEFVSMSFLAVLLEIFVVLNRYLIATEGCFSASSSLESLEMLFETLCCRTPVCSVAFNFVLHFKPHME